uniref:Uncharacterized protein n=1 Tax=Neogobius melanostomus TaxID=47308 RepID=A0A8C6TGR2_9GOBI
MVVLALREAALGCGCQVHHAGPFLLSCTHGVAGAAWLSRLRCAIFPRAAQTLLMGSFRDIATQISKDLEL